MTEPDPNPLRGEQPDADDHTDDATALWVRSDVGPNGDYIVGFSHGPDSAWSLGERAAREHAIRVAQAATTADHDSALVTFLTTVGTDASAIADVLRHIRVQRGLPGRAWPGPLYLAPAVRMDGKPFLDIYLHGTRIGQWAPSEARSHALGVLDAVAGAHLDSRLLKVLTRTLEIDEMRARAVVGTMIDHWPPAVWPEPAAGPGRG